MAEPKKEKRISFDHFVEYFPELEFPITLGEETHRIFSRRNDPLPGQAIAQFIEPLEPAEVGEEMTEYIACFRLPEAKEYIGLVYWKAELLSYQYKLVTFSTKDEQLIDQRVIAGTYYDGNEITQSAATIQESLQIYVVSGQSLPDARNYIASGSTATRLQVTERGKIVEL